MKGFFSEVSVWGDLVVVGKVIGIFFVIGGLLVGVIFDSFVQELYISVVNGDEDCICFVFLVLGEVIMRLGV